WGALAWLMLLAGLGGFGLIGPDEPRYAAIAAAMARTQDWITPRLWGAAWFEKPVLYYWLAGLSQRLRGVSAAAARLPNAVLAIATIAALWWFLRRTHGARAGALAGFLGLTTAFIFGFGRAATTDMTLAAPLTLGLLALHLWLENGEARFLPWCAAALALATLAKGPVAVALAAMVLVGWAACKSDWRVFRRALRIGPIAIFLAIAAPWYIAVEVENPQFFKIFFLQHNLERFATNRFEHPQPFWFYLPVLLLALFPWTGWLGLPLRSGWNRLRRLGWRGAWAGDDAALARFLTLWLLAPLVLFSISRSKLPGYILPAVPAAIALIAVAAAEAWERLPRWPLAISALLAGAVPAGLQLAPWVLLPPGLRPPLAQAMVQGRAEMLAALTAVVLLLLVLRRRPAVVMAATSILMAGGAAALTLGPLRGGVDAALSGQVLGRELRSQCGVALAGGLPRMCGTVPLFAWHLSRGLQYGAQFELGAEMEDWTNAAPPANSVLVMDRTSLPLLLGLWGGRCEMAQLSRFDPKGEQPVPWMAVRVRCAQQNAAVPPRTASMVGVAAVGEDVGDGVERFGEALGAVAIGSGQGFRQRRFACCAALAAFERQDHPTQGGDRVASDAGAGGIELAEHALSVEDALPGGLGEIFGGLAPIRRARASLHGVT